MQYGHFDSAQQTYTITDPHTPVRWINYLGTLAFGGFVDQAGGALICAADPALNRITKYLAGLPLSEFNGTALYLRLHESGGMRVFAPLYLPTQDRLDRFECQVGQGYSRWITEAYGVRCEVTMFIPQGDPVLIWDIRVTNLRAVPLSIDCIPLVEYTHFDALKQLTNADWVPQTMQSRAVREPDGHIVLRQYAFMQRGVRENLFTSSLPASSFETDRSRFLGHRGYGRWAAPGALEHAEFSNYEAHRGDNIAALMQPFGALAPGESQRLICLLTQAPGVEAARPLIETYREEAAVDAAFEALRAFWRETLDTLQVQTPEPALDHMLNVHNPHQCYITLNWSRYLSLYQLGYGARGIGFRDSSQDVMGALSQHPAAAWALLCKLLSVQMRNGSAMHQFNPLTMVASAGDSLEREEGPHYYSDDHLWAVLAVTAWLRETGDFSVLDDLIPYYEKDRDEQPLEAGTVRDHLERALAFTHGDIGAHGLPLLGFADWNDTVNLAKGAESVFTACLYGKALLEFAALLDHLGETTQADHYRAWHGEMAERVNAVAWDGAWYRRYFDAAGRPIGSAQNPAGQIFVNAQSWAVLAGFAPPERALQALDSVYERLNTPYGIKLSAPGYDGFDPALGGVSTYPPGAKENGGIFLHANPWAIIAETLIGRGERAAEYYMQINPAAKNEDIDGYECEPYVYAQNILGDEHPQAGLGRNSWLSGTASWMYQAGTQYLLGIRADYAGLRIDPCIPAGWTGFRASRRFRGARYEIEVSNPRGANRGVQTLEVDGQIVPGNVAPQAPAGTVVQVRVQLG